MPEVPRDPYDIDFKQLRTKYMDDKTKKISFSKPSFVHYCKNPYTYAPKYGGDDTILTMELIKAPNGLNYKSLVRPPPKKRTKKKAVEPEPLENADQQADKENEPDAEQNAEQEGEREDVQEEAQENNSQGDEGTDDNNDYDNYNDDDYSDEEYDNGGDGEGEEAEDEEEEEEQFNDNGERAYAGNMYKKEKSKINLVIEDRYVIGEKNEKTKSTDCVLISTWRIGKGQIRFSRIADVCIGYPPIETDLRFYCSHSGDALYYLSKREDGELGIVTVNLADFKFRFSPFTGGDIPVIKDLQDSSMICLNKVLVINVPEGLTPKKPGQVSGDFVAFNLQTLEKIWTATNAEKVFFQGFDSLDNASSKTKMFNDLTKKEKQGGEVPEDNTDGRQLAQDPFDKEVYQAMADYDPEDIYKANPYRKIDEPILILQLKVEEVEGVKTAEKKEGEKDVGPKKEAKLFYRFYAINNFQTKDFVKDGKLVYQHSEPTLLPAPAPAQEVTLMQTGINLFKEGIKKLIPAKIVDEAEEDGAQTRAPPSKPEVLCRNNDNLNMMVLIFVGDKNTSHRVLVFEKDGKDGLSKEAAPRVIIKPANTDITMNENSHLRKYEEMFIITTNAAGESEAKCVGEYYHLPSIEMEDVDKSKAIDVWSCIRQEDKPNAVVQTISKSSTSEFLNCASKRIGKVLIASANYAGDDEYKKIHASLKTNITKLKNQEIQMQYPVIVSNIGTRRLSIQSIVQPNIHGQYRLLDSDFIAFVNYKNLKQVGFEDIRPKNLKEKIPLCETGEFIAFLTRVHGVCDLGEDCKTGDLLLNLLYVDSYSEPMTFTLYTTDYEACMGEGCRDDVIRSAFAIEVKSARSTDATLCIQYNDSIVFDCITSTAQKPIMFPRPKVTIPKELKNEPEKKDLKEGEEQPVPKYSEKQIRAREIAIAKAIDEDEEFEDIKASKDCIIVPVPMIMDDNGFIYLLTTNAEKQVKVYRVNTEKEMGEESFFQLVYQFQATWVYFFQKVDDNFYMMDNSKRVRVLQQDPKTHGLSVKTTLELCTADKEQIVQQPFAEFAVSQGTLHYGNMVMFLLKSKTQDNPTWAAADISFKGYDCIAGPKSANGSGGQIYYVEEAQEKTPALFGQYCLVLMSKADHSFMSCLPVALENQNNFCSFIGKDSLMVQYGGKFLAFNTRADSTSGGMFDGAVEFIKADYINPKRLKLVCFCETKQYFVFEGPEMLPKNDEKKEEPKDAPKNQLLSARGNPANAVEKLAPKQTKSCYYIFKLQYKTVTYGDGRSQQYQLIQQSMPIEPEQDPSLKPQTTCIINPSGVLDLTKITQIVQTTKDEVNYVTYEVVLQSAKSSEIQILSENGVAVNQPVKIAPGDYTAISEVKFQFQFTAENLTAQKDNLTATLKPLLKAQTKAKAAKSEFKDLAELQRQSKRTKDMHKAWKLGNYVIAKCGSDVKYANVNDKIVKDFAFQLGPDVWLQNVYLTGVEGIVQFYAINDAQRHIYVISWNMELNREHTMFQTTYKHGQMPENLILSSYSSSSGHKQFNFCLEEGCIINLENNLPMQFFDVETEGDLVPHGALKNTVSGQKKISEDKQMYLDLLHPGRVQHFISLTDLLYWERYQYNKTQHELSRGKVTTFSPVSRFPEGKSIFHLFATNEKILETFREACELAISEKQDDKRILLMPLMFLHKFPTPNKAGHRVTPLQVSMEKQSPVCFEIMMSMLTEQQGVCITQHLLGKLSDLIGMGSPAVNELFNNSFRSTDQLSGPRPLSWPGDAEELFIDVPTAYLTDKTLQKLVYDKMKLLQPANDAAGDEAEPDAVDLSAKPPCTYNSENFIVYNVDTVEECVGIETQEGNMKQVEAKLLDFDWIFTKNNANEMIKVLAETDNDEIFSQSQVRVLIEFMWESYYNAIYRTLFIPYVQYFVAFNIYATQVGSIEGLDYKNFTWWLKIACLLVWGKNFATFFMLEIIQFKQEPLSYFTNFWNILDFLSLITCLFYVFFELTENTAMENPTNSFNIAILGSIAVLMLWMKLFYWLRLFKPFSAFIRIISEIGKDIKIFTAMLLLCLAAFANCLMVLNDNRILNGQNAIYDDLVGFGPANAMIHAYLTGMGDFNKDYYSEGNAVVVWIFFLMATVLVQLVFMNMLIAIMGESFGRITAITEQAVMKEVCVMMNDNSYLLDFGQLFKGSRYILWLTPGASKTPGTVVERQIQQLRSYVEERAEKTDTAIVRLIGNIDEKIDALTAIVENDKNPKAEEEEEGIEIEADDGEDDDDSYDDEADDAVEAVVDQEPAADAEQAEEDN